MQALFEWDFNNQQEDLKQVVEKLLGEFAGGVEDPEFAVSLAEGVRDNIAEIDKIIVKTAPEWPIDQITVIDRNILRLGIFELQYAHEVPPKVAINEAVELGKTFGGESSGKFVNGVLGTLYRQMVEAGKVQETESSSETKS